MMSFTTVILLALIEKYGAWKIVLFVFGLSIRMVLIATATLIVLYA